jgi:hypothetical protein
MPWRGLWLRLPLLECLRVRSTQLVCLWDSHAEQSIQQCTSGLVRILLRRTGRNGDTGPPPQAPRTLQKGDVIYAEVFSNFGSHHTQHQVLIAVDEVHEDFKRATRVARAVYDAGLQALRPGRKFSNFVKDMLKPMEGAGGWVIGPAVMGLTHW